MLSQYDLEMLSPHGCQTFMKKYEDCGDFWRVELEFQDKKFIRYPFKMILELPVAHGPHIIIDGVERTVLPSVTECGLRSRTETLRGLLQRALERGLCDFMLHGGPLPDSAVIMAEFRALVAKSEFIVDTPASSPLEREAYEQMIRIDKPTGNPIDISWREFMDRDWGRLDPNSTSQSDKINRVYRRGRGEHSLCDSIEKNIVFCRANPRRTFLTRTAFERHLPQFVPETPLVVNEKSQLSGKTLLTAFMDLGNTTFEDSIAVSQSAAAAMTCVRTIRQTWVGHKPLEIRIPNGTLVNPRALIAKTTDGLEGVHADKLHYPAKLVDVEVVPTLKFKEPAYKYVMTFEAMLPLRDGDKIAGRHGNKGIAWIIRDRDMPSIPHPDNPRMSMRIDVCLSPISVVKRRMMSIYLEGMAAKKAQATREQIVVPGWDIPDDLGFQALIDEGWGEKDQLYINGAPLPEKTFVAPLMWLRLDKIAAEQANCSSGKVVVNHLGLPIDAARVNGQKRDISKSLAFYHKPIRGIMKDTIERNTLGVKKCEAVIQALEPGFTLDSLLS